MELQLYRKTYSKNTTIGILTILGHLFRCHTLEDVCRDKNRDGDLNDPGETKIYGQTAIPAGRYELELYPSPKHGLVLQLIKVPQFNNVQIHAGNWAKDSLGCILVGEFSGTDAVYESRNALKRLNDIVFPALRKKEKCYITIFDMPFAKVA